MPRIILHRLAESLLALSVLLTVTFLLVGSLPGGRFQSPQDIPASVRQETSQHHGLGQPAPLHAINVAGRWLRLDPGTSLRLEGQPVQVVLRQAIPVSLQLILTSLLVASLIALPAAMITAAWPGSTGCRAVGALALTSSCLPPVVIGPLLADLAGHRARWLPVIGWDSGRVETWILPAITLGLAGGAWWAWHCREQILSRRRRAPASDLDAALVAGGPCGNLPRETLMPVLSGLPATFSLVVSCSIVVEFLFRIPGLGLHWIKSAGAGDAPVLTAIILVCGLAVIAAGFLTDLALALTSGDSKPAVVDEPLRRFRSRPKPATVASVIVLGIVLLACLAGPALPQIPAPGIQDLTRGNSPPSADHWLGTDHLGRDFLARVLGGGQVSFLIGLATASASLAIGIFFGGIAALTGGPVGALLSGTLKLLGRLPALALVILLGLVLAPPLTHWLATATGCLSGNPGPVATLFPVCAAIAAVAWIPAARVTRDTIHDTIAAGGRTGSSRASLRRITHDLGGRLLPAFFLTVPAVMLWETTLTFLGFGVSAPVISWGTLLESGASRMPSAPCHFLIPSCLLFATLAALRVLGNSLRDTPGRREDNH